jgi:hypothetical protein
MAQVGIASLLVLSDRRQKLLCEFLFFALAGLHLHHQSLPPLVKHHGELLELSVQRLDYNVFDLGVDLLFLIQEVFPFF